MATFQNIFQAGAFRRAVEERLRTTSQTDQIDINRLRRQLSFDRLLARLFHGEKEPWILKGGYALELRFGNARSTVDLDLTLQRVISSSSESVDVNTAVNECCSGRLTYNWVTGSSMSSDPAVMDLTAAPYGGGPYPCRGPNGCADFRSIFISTRALATSSLSRMTKSNAGTGWDSRASQRRAFA